MMNPVLIVTISVPNTFIRFRTQKKQKSVETRAKPVELFRMVFQMHTTMTVTANGRSSVVARVSHYYLCD